MARPSWSGGPQAGAVAVMSGFTLLELLVAMAIFIIMSAMIYSGLTAVLQTRQSVAAQSERLSELQLAFTILQRDLEQALPRPATDMDGSIRGGLMGDPSRGDFLELTHSVPLIAAGMQAKTMERVRYILDQGRIYREVWPSVDRAPELRVEPILLLQGVAQINIRFLNQKRAWEGGWDKDTLPLMVEFSVQLTNGERYLRLFRVIG